MFFSFKGFVINCVYVCYIFKGGLEFDGIYVKLLLLGGVVEVLGKIWNGGYLRKFLFFLSWWIRWFVDFWVFYYFGVFFKYYEFLYVLFNFKIEKM